MTWNNLRDKLSIEMPQILSLFRLKMTQASNIDADRLYQSVMMKYERTLQRGNQLKQREQELNNKMLYLSQQIKELSEEKQLHEIQHNKIKQLALEIREKLNNIENYQTARYAQDVERLYDDLKLSQDRVAKNEQILAHLENVDYFKSKVDGNVQNIKRYKATADPESKLKANVAQKLSNPKIGRPK